MTQLDLRIKYKSETGFAPTYGRYGEDDQLQLIPYLSFSSCNYKGNLTHEYTEWLENLKMSNPRDKYKNSTGENGIYYNQHGKLIYAYDYKNWLENELTE